MFYKVVELEKNLWAINEINKTILYFINGEKAVLLIDTGLGLSPLKKIIQQYCGEKEVIVVNTHSHIDHNSGNNQFDEVYVGRFDEPFSHTVPDIRSLEKAQKMFFQGNQAAKGFEMDKWNPGPAQRVKTLKDGDVFSLGGYDLEVIEVPSHTLGSIALVEKEKGWLFSGDIILTWEVWGHLTDGTVAPSASLKIYGESIHKLEQYKDYLKCIFPAHGKAECNPQKCTEYRIPPNAIEIYDKGIKKILDGRNQGKDYETSFAKGKVVFFEIGGILYNPDRVF